MIDTDTRKLYIGRSGELAVLSELLSRGYNATRPEIDIGEDVFVIEDGKEGYWPIQVKTAVALEKKNAWTAQYTFKRHQLITIPNVELTYILALRRAQKWTSFLVIPRKELSDNYRLGKLGKQKGNKLTWTVTYTKNRIHCQQTELLKYESNWDKEWPNILS